MYVSIMVIAVMVIVCGRHCRTPHGLCESNNIIIGLGTSRLRWFGHAEHKNNADWVKS